VADERQRLASFFNILTGKNGSLLPDVANRVKGLFVAVPQIARNSTTTPSNNPLKTEMLWRD
jgi:hypothetical protein